METQERRALLTISINPDETLDYITGMQGTLLTLNTSQPTNLATRYVPDRLIVNPESFSNYLVALSEQPWQSLEELATTFLGDLSNQLVARWICIKATVAEGSYPGLGAHEVLIEDRQPEWNNPSLLSRVKTF